MIRVNKSGKCSNLPDCEGVSVLLELLLGIFDTQMIKVSHRRHAFGFFKNAAKMSFAKTGFFHGFGQIKLMVADIFDEKLFKIVDAHIGFGTCIGAGQEKLIDGIAHRIDERMEIRNIFLNHGAGNKKELL